jgi:DNA mismatch endonuclease (patch repair protein)
LSDADEPPIEVSRSALMRRVSTKGSKPEMMVRRALHALGFRFRLHRRDLPGSPDIVLRRHRSVIFVHGCFWHRHPGCPRTTTPKTRAAFWQAKFDANQARDARVEEALRHAGWRVHVIWECEATTGAAIADLAAAIRAPAGDAAEDVDEDAAEGRKA